MAQVAKIPVAPVSTQLTGGQRCLSDSLKPHHNFFFSYFSQ
jgi:hypothetical protein